MSRTPTEAELAILRVLWELGPSTVREIHDVLTESKDVNYATTVKMLVIMHEKGLVKRDDSVRPQIYRSASPPQKTQLTMLNDLIQKVYDGSAKSLVQQLLHSRKNSAKELRELRKLLTELEGES